MFAKAADVSLDEPNPRRDGNQDPSSLIQAARDSHHARNWDEAERRWAHIRQVSPQTMVGYTGASATLREAGRCAAAEPLMAQALMLFPNEPAVHVEAAWLSLAQGKSSEAVALWEQIRDRFPDQWVAYLGAARALKAAGRGSEVEDCLQASVTAFPTQPVLLGEFAAAAVERKNWDAAAKRWAMLRDVDPARPNGYTGGAYALGELGRHQEAEALLQQAISRFPADPKPALDYAWIAHNRRDWTEAVRRWAELRANFPDRLEGYRNGAQSLGKLDQTAEAEALLRDAAERFPLQAGPATERASLALGRRDWVAADDLYAQVRARFPNDQAGYSGGIAALRGLRRFADAEALAGQAIERFPQAGALRIEQAWLAQVAHDWPVAIERWAAIRHDMPDSLAGYVQAARALREAWRHEDAEALLAEAMSRFPDAIEPATDHAALALSQHRWDEAQYRYGRLRHAFPTQPDGWRGGAAVLRYQFKFLEAEALLEQAMDRFPDVPQFSLDHAQLPIAPAFAHEKDWPETLRRLERLYQRYPAFETGFLTGIRLLKEAGYPGRAEGVAQLASERLTDSFGLAMQFAEAAEKRHDWPVAVARYSRVKDRFRNQPGGEIGLARALAGEGRFADAEQMLQETMLRFPADPTSFAEYADLAMRQENWAAGLQRWTDAQDRFPQERQFAHRIFDARLRMTESDPAAAVAFAQLTAAPLPDPDSTDPNVRDLVMQFESLGGRGLGCEFGIFQRDCGAEPLGLLRWADMPFDMLLFALRNRFDGVGSEEHTKLFVGSIGGGRGEYCTTDRRGMMFMRAFIYEDQAPFEKMQVSALNRLRFLTRKLIEDLEQGTKIFVFRLTDRNLTDAEVDQLHEAVRGYGNNTLLYVRYEDADHPNGTVEAVKPGLMIGYMDRFKMSHTGQLSAAPPTASWLAMCRNAYALWRASDRS
jgi:tetratricopeptide (TPR) repeat protein